MSWDEEIRSIHLITLFNFFGKAMVAVFLWYLLALIPLIIILAILV